MERDDRPLIAISSGVHAEKLATLENLILRVRAGAPESLVIRWFLDRGADHEPVTACARDMAESTWIPFKRRAVEVAISFWIRRGVLEKLPRRGDNGWLLPPRVRLVWGAVLESLGIAPGAVPVSAELVKDGQGPSRNAVSAMGPFVSEPCAGLPYTSARPPEDARAQPPENPSAPALGPSAPALGPSARLSLHGGLECALGRARGLVSVSVSVSDDVVRVLDIGSRSGLPVQGPCRIAWTDLDRIARKAAEKIFPGRAWWHTPPNIRKALLAFAILGEGFFGVQWLQSGIDAFVEGRKIRRPNNPINDPMRYLASILRERIFSQCGIGETSAAVDRSWFAALLSPIERLVERDAPRPQPPPEEPEKAARDEPMSAEEIAEIRAAGGLRGEFLARTRELKAAVAEGSP